MELNQIFDAVEKARDTAHWRAAFGEPHKVEDKVIIPLAQVTYGFGLGVGRGTGPSRTEDKAQAEDVAPFGSAGGGVGGGARTKPLGALVVTPESVYVEEAPDATKVALGAFLMVAFVVYQLAKTLRVVFGSE
jgi:uncharacterized spore protein YtfJ